jgi:hypothetical protein
VLWESYRRIVRTAHCPASFPPIPELSMLTPCRAES